MTRPIALLLCRQFNAMAIRPLGLLRERALASFQAVILYVCMCEYGFTNHLLHFSYNIVLGTPFNGSAFPRRCHTQCPPTVDGSITLWNLLTTCYNFSLSTCWTPLLNTQQNTSGKYWVVEAIPKGVAKMPPIAIILQQYFTMGIATMLVHHCNCSCIAVVL